MLTNKLSTDKAFSFGKNNTGTLDQETNDFKADSNDKSIQRGRNPIKKNENAHSGGVLLTFGMDKENLQRSMHYYTPPHDSRSGANVISALFDKKNKNVESLIESKLNNYNSNKDSEKNFDTDFKLKTNGNVPQTNNFFLRNADKLIHAKETFNSTNNFNSNNNCPLKRNEGNASRSNLGLVNNAKKKVVINESKNVYNTLNEKRDKSWSYPERTLNNENNTNSQKNLKKKNSKKDLNALNTTKKSFSPEQYSEYMKIKNSGLVRDLSQTTLTSRNERNLSPLLKLKEKLSDNFMHFLKKHRFSAVMVGNSLYQGKTGNFYINMKNNNEQLQNFNPEFLNNSIILKTLENTQANEKQDKGFNDRESRNNIDSQNQSLNQSLDEKGKKIFDEKTKQYINSNTLNIQNRNIFENLLNTNSKSSLNPAESNAKYSFEPNNIQENYKNYKDSLNNNNNNNPNLKLDDTLNFFTNQTEEKLKEDFNIQNINNNNDYVIKGEKDSSHSKIPEVYLMQLNSTSKKSSSDLNANKNSINCNNNKSSKNSSSIGSYGNNSAKLATNNNNKKSISSINNTSLNSTLGASKLNNTIAKNSNINYNDKITTSRNSNPAFNKISNIVNNNTRNIQNSNAKSSTQNLNTKGNLISNRNASMGKVPDANYTASASRKANFLPTNLNLTKNLMSESEKKSSSQSKISQSLYDKYSNNFQSQNSKKAKNNFLENKNQSSNLNNSNLSNGTSMRSSSNQTIIYNPSSNSNLAAAAAESRNNETTMRKTKSRNNLNSVGFTKNLSHSHSGNNIDNTLQNETNNNDNYLNTNSNQNNYFNVLNNSTYNNKTTNNNKNGALRPEEILSYETFKNLERIISLQKGFVDLTPIPMKKEDLKTRVDQIEYSAAERAAVLIRRMEYSHNLKSSKVELSEVETKEFYLKLLIEAKTIIIQRWWRKMLRRLCWLHLRAQRIQAAFRGFIFREAFSFAYRNTKVVFPFISKVIEIMRKNSLVPPFVLLSGLFRNQKQFEFVLKGICLVQRAFREFLGRKRHKCAVVRGFVLAKHFNCLKFYFEKLKRNVDFLGKVVLLQSRARGINARNPQLFAKKELESLKRFKELKEKKYEEANNAIINNRNLFSNNNNNNSTEDSNVVNYPNNISSRKTFSDIGLLFNSKHRSSILKMIKDEKFTRYSPLLLIYLSCQRLHSSRQLGYREYKTQKFYLVKFIEKASEKFLRKKKANKMRIRNNAIGDILNVKEKILKSFHFKKYRKVSESLGKLGLQALFLMKTTLKVFVWKKLLQKLNRKALKHTAFKCVKNYMLRMQRNLLRRKFQNFKLNATHKGKQILKLHMLEDKFNKKNAKAFFEKFKNNFKLTPKKLEIYERVFKAGKIINNFFAKKAFNSIKLVQFIKLRKFIGFVTGKFLVPKALKYKSLAFEKILMKNFESKKKIEKAKIGFELLFKFQNNLRKKAFVKIKEKVKSVENAKYLEDNYKLKNSNLIAKEKFSLVKTFEILEKLLTKKERKFFQSLKKIEICNKLLNSGIKIIYRILSKKLLEYSYYFFSRFSNKQIFKHFNGILKAKEFAESNLNNIAKANFILNNLVMQKGKKANFDKLKNYFLRKNLIEQENKSSLKTDLIKKLLAKKLNKNFNLKKLYFYKFVRKTYGIKNSEYANVFSGLAAYILNKIKIIKLRKLLANSFINFRKQKISEIKNILNTIDNECYPVTQNGQKKFTKNKNNKSIKFMQNDELENKIRYKLIVLGNKSDKKYILQKYFNKFKLNKIIEINKIKKIQNCFRTQSKKAETKKSLIQMLFENLVFKYQKMKEKYFYRFANEIIAKKHKRSATTLRDFMRNYTLAAKKRRLLTKLVYQVTEDYKFILLQKFQIFKGNDCLIYYSNKKNLAGKRIEIKNYAVSSNFKNENDNNLNNNENNNNIYDATDNKDIDYLNNHSKNVDYMHKGFKTSISFDEKTPSSDNFGLSTDNTKRRVSTSKSLIVKSENRGSNFKNKNDFNFSNDLKNSSYNSIKLKLSVNGNEQSKFPSIIQGGSDEEYDSAGDVKKPNASSKLNVRQRIVNENQDQNKTENYNNNNNNNDKFNLNDDDLNCKNSIKEKDCEEDSEENLIVKNSAGLKINNIKGNENEGNQKKLITEGNFDSYDKEAEEDRKLSKNNIRKNINKIESGENNNDSNGEFVQKRLSIRGKSQIINVVDLNNGFKNIEKDSAAINLSPKSKSIDPNANENDSNLNIAKSIRIRGKSSIVYSDQDQQRKELKNLVNDISNINEKKKPKEENEVEEEESFINNQINSLKNNLVSNKDSCNKNENQKKNINNNNNNRSPLNKNSSNLIKNLESESNLKNKNNLDKIIENIDDNNAAIRTEKRSSRFNFSNLHLRKSVNESKSADYPAEEQNKNLKTSKSVSNLTKQNLNVDVNSNYKQNKNSNSSEHFYDKKKNSAKENLNDENDLNYSNNNDLNNNYSKINNDYSDNRRNSDVSENEENRRSSNGKFSTLNLRHFNKINKGLRKSEYINNNDENEDFEKNNNNINKIKNTIKKENDDSENNSYGNSNYNNKSKYEIKSNLFRKDKKNEKDNKSNKSLNYVNKEIDNHNENEENQNANNNNINNSNNNQDYSNNRRLLNQNRAEKDNYKLCSNISNIDIASGNPEETANDEENDHNNNAKYPNGFLNKNICSNNLKENFINGNNNTENVDNDDNNFTNFGSRILKQNRTYSNDKNVKEEAQDENEDFNNSEKYSNINNNCNYDNDNAKGDNNLDPHVYSLKVKHDKTAEQAYIDFLDQNTKNNTNSKIVLKNNNHNNFNNLYKKTSDNDLVNFLNNDNNKKDNNNPENQDNFNKTSKLNDYLKTIKKKDLNQDQFSDNNTPSLENSMNNLKQNNFDKDKYRKFYDYNSIEGKLNNLSNNNLNNNNDFSDDNIEGKVKSTFIRFNNNNLNNKTHSNMNNVNNDYKSASTNIVTDVTNIYNSRATKNAYGSQVNYIEKSDEENTEVNNAKSNNIDNLLIKDNNNVNNPKSGNDEKNNSKDLKIRNLNNKMISSLGDAENKFDVQKENNSTNIENDDINRALKGKITDYRIFVGKSNTDEISKDLKINSNSKINVFENAIDNKNQNINIQNSNYTQNADEVKDDIIEMQDIKKKVLRIKKTNNAKEEEDDCDSSIVEIEKNNSNKKNKEAETNKGEEEALKLSASKLRQELTVKTPTKETEEEAIQNKKILKNYIKRLSFKNENCNSNNKSNNNIENNNDENNDLGIVNASADFDEKIDKTNPSAITNKRLFLGKTNENKNEEDNGEQVNKSKDKNAEEDSIAKKLNSNFNEIKRKQNHNDQEEKFGTDFPKNNDCDNIRDENSSSADPNYLRKRSIIKERRRSFNEFIVKKETLKKLILKQTDKKFFEFSISKFYQFKKICNLPYNKFINSNIKNQNNICIKIENKKEAQEFLFDLFNFYYRKTELSDIIMFLKVLKRDSSISKIQKFWRRKSVVVKEKRVRNFFVKRIIAKEVTMNRSLYLAFDKWLKQVQKISEHIVRVTKFRRLQNLLHRFSKDIILNVLIRTLSSKKIEAYEQVC